jgi:hypothetical protein
MSRSWGAKLSTFLTLGGKTRAHLLRYTWRACTCSVAAVPKHSLTTYFQLFLKQHGNYLG